MDLVNPINFFGVLGSVIIGLAAIFAFGWFVIKPRLEARKNRAIGMWTGDRYIKF